jgi:hypothetical protein
MLTLAIVGGIAFWAGGTTTSWLYKWCIRESGLEIVHPPDGGVRIRQAIK